MKFTLLFLSVLLILEPAVLCAQSGSSISEYGKAEFCSETIDLYNNPDEYEYLWKQFISGTEKFKVIDEENDYYLIKLSDGREGWVKSECIAFVERSDPTAGVSVSDYDTPSSANRLYNQIYIEPVESGSGQVSESGSINMQTQRNWVAYQGNKRIDIIKFLELTGYTSELEAHKAYHEANEDYKEQQKGPNFIGIIAGIGTMIFLYVQLFKERNESGTETPLSEDTHTGVLLIGLAVGALFYAIFSTGKKPKKPNYIPYQMACDMAADYNAKIEMNKADDNE